MAAARIAAVLLVALPSLAFAQQDPALVTVQVTDVTGAPIPGSRIEVDPLPSSTETTWTTDQHGRASFSLAAGAHELLVSNRGFQSWSDRVDLPAGGSETVAANLCPNGTICDSVQVTTLPPDIPLLRPDPVYIVLQPLFLLDPLPSRQVKKRWWRASAPECATGTRRSS